MPRYQVFYLRDTQVQKFRNAAPKEKPYSLRIKDYEEGETIEAPTPYALWKQFQEVEGTRERPFAVGDVLESDESELLVLNFWGFDEAQWRAAEDSFEEGELQALAASAGTVGEEPRLLSESPGPSV